MKKFNCIKSTTQFFVSTVIGVNISERKSGTERTKKRELVFFSTSRGRNGTVVHRLDATPILPELR